MATVDVMAQDNAVGIRLNAQLAPAMLAHCRYIPDTSTLCFPLRQINAAETDINKLITITKPLCIFLKLELSRACQLLLSIHFFGDCCLSLHF